MAEDSEKTGAQASKKADKAKAYNFLPVVESPSISPAAHVAAASASAGPGLASAAIPFTGPAANSSEPPEFIPATPRRLRLRHQMMAGLAASVVIASGVGIMAGFMANDGFRTAEAPKVDTAAVEERAAMQQSIAQLNAEIGTLKASLDAAKKTATTQIAKVNARLDKEAADITGSISAPQTTAPQAAQATLPAQAATPMPTPRPVQTAAIQSRPPVITDWTVRDSRNGFVYVQNGQRDLRGRAGGALARPRRRANAFSARTATGSSSPSAV